MDLIQRTISSANIPKDEVVIKNDKSNYNITRGSLDRL